MHCMYNVMQIIEMQHMSQINTCKSAIQCCWSTTTQYTAKIWCPHNNTFSFYFHKLTSCSGEEEHFGSNQSSQHHSCQSASSLCQLGCNDAQCFHLSTNENPLFSRIDQSHQSLWKVWAGASNPSSQHLSKHFQRVPTWTQKCKIILLSSHTEMLFADDLSSASIAGERLEHQHHKKEN